jgi:hypothetical protein
MAFFWRSLLHLALSLHVITLANKQIMVQKQRLKEKETKVKDNIPMRPNYKKGAELINEQSV